MDLDPYLSLSFSLGILLVSLTLSNKWRQQLNSCPFSDSFTESDVFHFLPLISLSTFPQQRVKNSPGTSQLAVVAAAGIVRSHG